MKTDTVTQGKSPGQVAFEAYHSQFTWPADKPQWLLQHTTKEKWERAAQVVLAAFPSRVLTGDDIAQATNDGSRIHGNKYTYQKIADRLNTILTSKPEAQVEWEYATGIMAHHDKWSQEGVEIAHDDGTWIPLMHGVGFTDSCAYRRRVQPQPAVQSEGETATPETDKFLRSPYQQERGFIDQWADFARTLERQRNESRTLHTQEKTAREHITQNFNNLVGKGTLGWYDDQYKKIQELEAQLSTRGTGGLTVEEVAKILNEESLDGQRLGGTTYSQRVTERLNARRQPVWRDVRTDPPTAADADRNGRVLYNWNGSEVMQGSWSSLGNQATHWMPIPDLPPHKVDGDDERVRFEKWFANQHGATPHPDLYGVTFDAWQARAALGKEGV